MRHLITVSLLLVLALGIHQTQQTEQLRVAGTLSPITQRALTARGIDYTFDGLMTTISCEEREGLRSALLTALATHRLQFETAQHNLSNLNTTRTCEGWPYRRLEVLVGDDGAVLDVREDESEFHWLYDLSHPDARKDGPHRGYVALPNIDAPKEWNLVARSSAEASTVRAMLRQVDPDLVFSRPF